MLLYFGSVLFGMTHDTFLINSSFSSRVQKMNSEPGKFCRYIPNLDLNYILLCFNLLETLKESDASSQYKNLS